MVNGVHSNNHVNSYANSSVRPSKTDMDAPPFLLQYDEKGVVWERSDQQDQKTDKSPKTEKESAAARNADTREKSYSAQKTEASPEAKKKSEETDIGKTVRNAWDRVKKFFVDIFNFIWYGEEQKEETSGVKPAAAEKDAIPEGETAAQESKDALIREMIARHDTDGVVNILTENHTIRPAHNSTLLTYYNQHGRIVDLSQTNTNRILHGDRNTRDL